MGVSVEQVLTELAQRSSDEPNNGTVPTPLTNYLDVRRYNQLQIKWSAMLGVHGAKQLNWQFRKS